MVCAFWIGCVFSISAVAQVGLTQLTAAQRWQRLEFSVTSVPVAANPFDPDVIRIDATFTMPSGRALTVPAFWYQAYQRTLSGGYEYDPPTGAPGWRLRFLPVEAGPYTVSVAVRTNDHPYGSPFQTGFTVLTNAAPARSGYVGLAPGHQYFQTGDGQALRLIGENVGWYDTGTYDYDTWFANMTNAGENYARIWMCPWAFGIEDTATSSVNYSLNPAWRLDYVLQLAEQKGIYLLLCLDFHGMFATQPDSWGGDNYWPQNPYNASNGGPCTVANDFFTSSAAANLYEKRLRYLIARYGYSQNLLAWELFNEIDNDYDYLNATDVAAWHGKLGGWLHTNDVFGHLVTTSLTGSSDRPEIWSLPQLDFAAYHSYGEPAPAMKLSSVAQSFMQRYGKPVMVGEFGTDAGGWNRTNDPYLRGFRQGIWGGALSGSVGTAMSWWWENIDGENDYPTYSGLGAFLAHTGWAQGVWTNVVFQTSGTAPTTIGNTLPGGQPVNVQLPLNGGWGTITPGQLAVPGPVAANNSAQVLEAFFHGYWKPTMKTPFHLNAWLTNNARIVLHLNSVSDGSVMAVFVDGSQVFSTNLANLDGGYSLDEEYNLDVAVALPSGKHFIDVTNLGSDWFYLDWVRLDNVLPSAYANNWTPSPAAIGLRGANESLLYVVAPGVSFPANATTAAPPLQPNTAVILTNWPAGNYFADWYDPSTGAFRGRATAAAAQGGLTLTMPDFTEDLAAVVYAPPRFSAPAFSAANGFQWLFNSESGGHYAIEKSSNLANWSPYLSVTNASGTITLIEPPAPTNRQSFFRAHKVN